ncbi:type II secretion system F family protein [Verrucomicrobiota bacterium]
MLIFLDANDKPNNTDNYKDTVLFQVSTEIDEKLRWPWQVRMEISKHTGKIDEMMESIADFYDDEVMTMLDGLTSLIEPLLMVFLGVVIGGIVISMFLPIFKMGEIVGG